MKNKKKNFRSNEESDDIELLKFALEIQKGKMKELWGNDDYEAWEKLAKK